MSKEPVKSINEPSGKGEYKTARERAQHITEDERMEIDQRQRSDPEFIEHTKPEDPSPRPGQLTRDNVNPNIPSGPKDRPLLPDGRVDPNAGGIVDPNTLGMEGVGGGKEPNYPPPPDELRKRAAEGKEPTLPDGTPLPRAGSINEPPGSNVLAKTSEDIPDEIKEKGKPTISGLEPDEAASGSADFTLVVSGENFFSGSVLVFGAHDEPTTFDEEAKTVSTIVKPSLFQPAVVPVKVRNGSMVSDPSDFTFTAPAGRSKTAKGPEASDDPDEIEDELDQMEEEGEVEKRGKSPSKKK